VDQFYWRTPGKDAGLDRNYMDATQTLKPKVENTGERPARMPGWTATTWM